MKQANLIATNEVVIIISVSGGWTTINNNGVEQKVRNSALSMPWEAGDALVATPNTAKVTPAAAVVKIEKTTKKADPKKAPKKSEITHHGMNTTVCPKCGSEELYCGRAPDGIVIDEDKIIGCHSCDWEYKVPGFTDGLRRVKNSVYDPNDYVKAKSTSGNASMHCGDAVAITLTAMEYEDVLKYAAPILGTTVEALRKRYEHLNQGMRRMNIANRLRALSK